MISIADKNNTSNKEIVSLTFSFKDGNYIGKIFYELETNNAVMFGRNIDDNVLFIPKSALKVDGQKIKRKLKTLDYNLGLSYTGNQENLNL